MIKDHSDSERGNPLPLHGLLFPISSKGYFIDGLCYSSRGALAGTRNSSMGPPNEGSIRQKGFKDSTLFSLTQGDMTIV